jgi:hypothetical protein
VLSSLYKKERAGLWNCGERIARMEFVPYSFCH